MTIQVTLDQLTIIASHNLADQQQATLALEKIASELHEQMVMQGLKVESTFSSDGTVRTISLVKGVLLEQLIRISIPKFTKVISFDFNPKRMRGTPYETILSTYLRSMRYDDWQMHATRADIAIDMVDERDAHALEITKSRAVASRERDDMTGALQTKYYGARGSDVMVRVYDKSVETRKRTLDEINKITYNALKLHSELKQASLDHGIPFNVNELAKKAEVTHLLNTFKQTGLKIDISDSKQFRFLLDQLARENTDDLKNIPDNWWRFEFQLRTAKLEKGLPFDELLDDWLEYLAIPIWDTIDDPELRVWVLAWKAKKATKKEAPPFMQQLMTAINKWSKIDIYSINGRKRIVKHGVIPLKADGTPHTSLSPPETITRATENALFIKKIKREFKKANPRLNKEFSRYLE